MTISFFVPGHPKGQPRPRAFACSGKARVYDPGTAEGWKSQIAQAARECLPETPMDGPLAVTLVFWFKRPKGHFRQGKRASELRDDAPVFHCSKPDCDNAVKAVLDCLTQLGMWHDDRQVAGLGVRKFWASGSVGCQVGVRHLTD